MLAEKHDNLLLKDFEPYMDLSMEQGSLYEILEFEYNGETMCLGVSSSDKSAASAPYEGELDGEVFFHKDFLAFSHIPLFAHSLFSQNRIYSS